MPNLTYKNGIYKLKKRTFSHQFIFTHHSYQKVKSFTILLLRFLRIILLPSDRREFQCFHVLSGFLVPLIAAAAAAAKLAPEDASGRIGVRQTFEGDCAASFLQVLIAHAADGDFRFVCLNRKHFLIRTTEVLDVLGAYYDSNWLFEVTLNLEVCLN